MRFFRLRDDERFPEISWDADKIHLGTTICPLDSSHQGADRVLVDLHVILPSVRIADVCWTFLSECLITDRVAELLSRESMTGYYLAPVTVTGVKKKSDRDKELPRLWELRILGWAGMADKASGVTLSYNCPGCGYFRYKGYSDSSKLIVPEQWDGSDFFMVWPLPRYIMVSERVRELFLKEKLTGAEIIPVEQLGSMMRDGDETLSPGRLRDWMPEERARLLGEPLGIY